MTELPDAAAVMPQARRENFPVASVLLPRRQRSHLLALYGVARLIDDTGDEAAGDRLELLDALEHDLERVWSGPPRTPPSHPLLGALVPTVRACQLPIEPFRALVEANRRDQLVTRYATWDELRGYCALSADPVGELVLRVFGAATPERLACSSDVCTALQLTEHLQDVAEDRRAGRIYLPAEDMERFGVGEDELSSPACGPAEGATPRFRALMAFEVERAERLLDAGAPLVRTLRGRPRLAVAAFVAGGRSALEAIARADFDVLGASPRPGPARRLRALLREVRQ